MTESTVAAGYAKALLDFAVSKGASAPSLLDAAGIAPEDLEDPDTRIPMTRFVALMRSAKALCKNPALALEFGATSKISQFSIVGLIAYSAANMADAFEQVNRFGQLVIEVDKKGPARFRLVRDDAGLWMEDTRLDANSFPELTESTFARFIGDFRRAYGDTPFARLAHVTHPEPPHHEAYDRLLGVPVVFESDRNALLIDEAWPSIPIGRGNRYVFGVFSSHAQALLEDLEKSRSVRGQVESLLIPLLHKGEVSMVHIAEELGMSRQTLYRKLKAEGTNFETLLDELRHKMALHYLNDNKVSVTEAAYLVGFSEPSSFSRAFKRWTGRGPGDYR